MHMAAFFLIIGDEAAETSRRCTTGVRDSAMDLPPMLHTAARASETLTSLRDSRSWRRELIISGIIS